MNIKKVAEVLKGELSNGGVVEDSYTAITAITAVNSAKHVLNGNPKNNSEIETAQAFIDLCASSGVDSLVCAATS